MLYQHYDVSILRGLKSVDRVQHVPLLEENVVLIRPYTVNKKNMYYLHVFYQHSTQSYAVFLSVFERKRSLWTWFPTIEEALAQTFRIHYFHLHNKTAVVWKGEAVFTIYTEDYDDFVLLDESVACIMEGFRLALSL